MGESNSATGVGEESLIGEVATGGEAADYPPPAVGWYVVFVLFLAYTLSYVDRQILALLIDPIRADLNISDTQISLVHGFAFSILYTILGIPIGRLADRANRKYIIAAGITVWSAMTAGCGLARSFAALFLTRIGVGVGEAALSPAAYSIIADYFPKERRARPVTTYSLGVYVGAGLAFIFGGWVIGVVSSRPDVVLPVVGTLEPWQLTFVLVALPAAPVLMLLSTIREPVRRELLERPDQTDGYLSLREAAAFMWQRRALYASIVLSASSLAIIGYGFFSWLPSHFIRNFGWTPTQFGTVFGLLLVLFGTGGMYTAGLWADRLYAKGVGEAPLKVVLFSVFILVIPAILTPLMPDPVWALVLLAPSLFFLSFHVGLPPAALQQVTPNQMRAQVTAIYIFFVNLIGLGAGPTVIAMITDFVFGDPEAVGKSLAIATAVAASVALLLLRWAIRELRTYSE